MACAGTATTRRLIVAAALTVAGCGSGEEVTQPFPFNHAAHIEAEVECLQCHEGVLDAAEHRLPTLEACMSCHDEPPPADKPDLVRLAEIAKAGDSLDWDPALRLADHVFFPHLRHVDIAELECTECHGDMPGRTVPPPRRRTVTMDECIDCHADNSERPSARRAVTDCASCHR